MGFAHYLVLAQTAAALQLSGRETGTLGRGFLRNPTTELSSCAVQSHGAAAAAYMLSAQREDGLFAYELDVSETPAPPDPKNWMDGEPYGSVVRQAGAALFLADFRPQARDLEPQVRNA